MSVRLRWPVFDDNGCVRCEKGGLVDESFSALRYWVETVVRERGRKGVEWARGLRRGWRFDWRYGPWLGHNCGASRRQLRIGDVKTVFAVFM